MIQSMFSGASGLRAHQTQMDVIGNNISNINTVGFKASRAEFKAALSRTLRGGSAPGAGVGGTDPVQVGLGVSVGNIGTIQTQGSLQYTGKPLDIAIEGGGFFVLGDGVGQYFTRDGSMTVDANGSLVTTGSTGYRVMGWSANPTTGIIDSASTPGEIRLPLGQWALARQTSEVTYAGNLDVGTADGGTYSTKREIFDSLGKAYDLTVTFTKQPVAGTDNVTWTWTATATDPTTKEEVGTFSGTSGNTITFDQSGKVISGGTPSTTLTLSNPGGANATLNLALDFTSLTSLAGTSSAVPTNQNGLPLGTLNSYTIDPSGVIIGTFSNGMTQSIAQIALADFTNPGGLSRIGGNIFSQSANSGLPQIGTPASGGRGKLSSGYLEMSNVDLSIEFTNMIIAQRGFQANSRIITTSDEMLQDLISLKR